MEDYLNIYVNYKDSFNLLTLASPELGTAQPQLVKHFCHSPTQPQIWQTGKLSQFCSKIEDDLFFLQNGILP
jgi:hypothetical protein